MDETKNVAVEVVEEIIPDTTDVEVTITELPPVIDQIKKPGFGRYVVIGAGLFALAGLAYVGIKKLTNKKTPDQEAYEDEDDGEDFEDDFYEAEEADDSAGTTKEAASKK